MVTVYGNATTKSFIRDFGCMANVMGLVSVSTKPVISTEVNGDETGSMARGFGGGRVVRSTRECGFGAGPLVMEQCNGPMARASLESSSMARDMVTASADWPTGVLWKKEFGG